MGEAGSHVPWQKDRTNIMLGHNRKMTGRGMPGRHARGLRRHPRVSWCRRCLRSTFAEMERRTKIKRHPRARRKVRRLHGRRLCARVRQARHLHGAGDRRAQSRGRPARRLARAFAGDRDDRRARAEDQVPQGLPGGRRRAGVRAGDQVQRHGRRRRRAFPTWCGRRSASRPPARPARCICSSAATRARSTPRKREMEPLVEPQFARVPPFRPAAGRGERAGGAEAAAEGASGR